MAADRKTPNYGRRILWLAVFVAILFGGYSVGWYYLADQLVARAKSTIADMNRNGVTVECDDPVVHGFPFRLGVYCDRVAYANAGDATAAITEQIERFAPGFRDRIVGTAVRSATEMAVYNPNYVGGDIIGGATSLRQTLFRPRFTPNPYATGIPGVYLCSASTPPGAGAHGMCGANAANRALAHLRTGRDHHLPAA